MIKELNDQIGGVKTSEKAMGADFTVSLGKISTGLSSVQEDLKHYQSDVVPAQNKRMLRMEMYNARLLHEITTLHEQMGSQLSHQMDDIMAGVPPLETQDTAELPQIPQVKSQDV